MSEADESAQKPRSRRAWLAAMSSAAGVVVAVVGLAFVVRSVVADWDETQQLLRKAEWVWLLAALPVALAGMTAVGVPWRAIMGALGQRPTVRSTLRWYFPGQLGKYVPGGFWPVIGRGELAVRGGADRPLAYASVGLSLALTYLAAALVGSVLAVAALAGGGDARAELWALLLLPAGMGLLHPRLLRSFVTAAERVLSREVPVQVPDYGTTVRLLLAHVPAWLIIGSATWLVARAFHPSPEVAPVLFAAVLSWIVGFVVVVVPGGLGVREAAFAAVAAATLGADVAATVAIAARLCFVVADVGGAALVVVIGSGNGGVTGKKKASPVTPPAARP